MAVQTNTPLPDGLELEGYKILRRISSGGFSIVYLVEDLNRKLFVIKEYLPSALVRRSAGMLAPHIIERSQETFLNGLRCFFEEGRALARVFHPNVVRVVNFFRANDTVYMVMDYERGQSLQEVISRHRGCSGQEVIPEKHLLRLFYSVMSGLREVHANRLLHLDLKPANIYIRLDGAPLLLDFGAARRALDIEALRLYPMYTPGFAPPELYRRGQQLGPWTDVYGIGASIFTCITGYHPPAADQRVLDDSVPDLLEKVSVIYSRSLLDLVSWCLKMNPLERPQSVFLLQKVLRAVNPKKNLEEEDSIVLFPAVASTKKVDAKADGN